MNPAARRLRRLLTAFGLSLGLPAAAGRDPAPPLGAHPKDQASLADSPLLAHLAAALEPGAPGAPRTAEALLRSDDWRFVSAPRPEALLASDAARGRAQAPAAEDAVPLRVLTYNTGLLDRKYIAGHVAVPQVPTRRRELPERLLSDGWDVILLQEVWEWSDVARFAGEAERRGYRWWAGEEQRHVQHGILILVKAELIAGEEDKQERQFEAQRCIERWPGPNVRRGYLTWTFTHAPTGQRLRVASAHPQAWPKFWGPRSLQARQLGLDLGQSPDDVVVLLGVDLNAAPYYPHDQFGAVKDAPVEDWWRNAVTYPLIRHYGDLLDVAALAAPAGDITAMDALPAWSPAWRSAPVGGACAGVQPGVFTGTDCNSLYFASYGGEEYPARLDYLFLRDREGVVRVERSAHVYVEPLAFASGSHELSDHYGVMAELRLRPRAR